MFMTRRLFLIVMLLPILRLKESAHTVWVLPSEIPLPNTLPLVSYGSTTNVIYFGKAISNSTPTKTEANTHGLIQESKLTLK